MIKCFVSLIKAGKIEPPQAFQINRITSFYKVTEGQSRTLSMKENKDWNGRNIASIYFSFLFQMHMELGSKNFIKENCAQKLEELYPIKQETFLRGGEKDFLHDLTVFVILCKGKYWHLPDCLLQLSDLLQFIFITTLSMGLLPSSLGLTELSRFVTTASRSCYRTSKTS